MSDGEITATLIGEDPGDGAGFIVAPAGDQDGDGLADVLVASTQHVDEDLDGSLVEGAVYVVTGPISGDIDLADYNALAGNFAPAGYGAAAVPEPASVCLLLAALLVLARVRF